QCSWLFDRRSLYAGARSGYRVVVSFRRQDLTLSSLLKAVADLQQPSLIHAPKRRECLCAFPELCEHWPKLRRCKRKSNPRRSQTNLVQRRGYMNRTLIAVAIAGAVVPLGA